MNFQIKAKSTSNKSNVGLQGPGKMTKPVFVSPHISQVSIHLSADLVIGFSISLLIR